VVIAHVYHRRSRDFASGSPV